MCSDEYFCVQLLANTRSREKERSWSDYLERKLDISFPPRSRIAHFPWLQCNVNRALESQVYCCMWGVKRPVSSWAQLDSRMLAGGLCGTWQKGFLHSKAAEQWFLNISSISILPWICHLGYLVRINNEEEQLCAAAIFQLSWVSKDIAMWKLHCQSRALCCWV